MPQAILSSDLAKAKPATPEPAKGQTLPPKKPVETKPAPKKAAPEKAKAVSKSKFPGLTPQEDAVYMSIKAVKRKTGIKVEELRDAFPDIAVTRLSDVLRHLVEKKAIEKLKLGFYTAL